MKTLAATALILMAGAALATAQAPVIHCGHPAPADIEFCRQQGFGVGAPAVAAAPGPTGAPNQPPGAVIGQLHWRDGYIDGGRYIRAKWQTIEADNGAVLAVDMGSVVHGANGGAYVVAYAVEGELFDPNGMRAFNLDCAGHFTVMSPGAISPLTYAPPRSVAGQVAALVCQAPH